MIVLMFEIRCMIVCWCIKLSCLNVCPNLTALCTNNHLQSSVSSNKPQDMRIFYFNKPPIFHDEIAASVCIQEISF